MDVVADFLAITECGSEDVAVHYLSTTDFNLHEAVALYNEEKAAMTAAERAATHDAADTPATSHTPPRTSLPTSSSSQTPPPLPAHTLPSSSSSARAGEVGTGAHVVVDTLGTTHALPTSTHSDSHAYYARNPFENSSNPALREMYTTPSYVQAFVQPLTAVCERAAQRDRWVLLAIRDGSFACVALPRDVWRLDAMTSMAPSVDCYEADVRTMDGRQLARDLRVNTQEQPLPVLLLLDPVTSYCERRIVPTMDAMGAIDGKAIVNEVLCFLADHGSPHQYLDQRQPPAPSLPQQAASSRVVVEEADDDDDDVGSGSGGNARRRHGRHGVTSGGAGSFTSGNDDDDDDDDDVSVEDVSPMTSPNVAVAGAPRNASVASPVLPQPVSIDAWQADTTSGSSAVYRLRCRLPRSTLDLSLKPSTPLSVLLQYLAYAVYDADRTLYNNNTTTTVALPRITLHAGFPPRAVALPADTAATTLADCRGFRSGDVLTVKADKPE